MFQHYYYTCNYLKAVGRTSPTIDSKVCNKKVAVDDSVVTESRTKKDGPLVEAVHVGRKETLGDWSCVDYQDDMKKTVYEYKSVSSTGSSRIPKKELATRLSGSTLSVRFKRGNMPNEPQEDVHGSCRRNDSRLKPVPCTGDEGHNTNGRGDSAGIEDRWWAGKQTNRGWPGTAEGKINTAQGMAGDLVSNLDSEEKSDVAGILTRTVSGGEVVEVTAVTTTSVMANVCYDLEHPVAVPFGCVGFGTNIISVADGHVDAKLAYRIQGGLSYNVTPRVTAFISGYYHKVLGEGEYDDIPVERLRDDQSPEGRSKNYALARFKMAYVGAEMGVRFAF